MKHGKLLLAVALVLAAPIPALRARAVQAAEPQATNRPQTVEPIALEELLETVRAKHKVAALGAALLQGDVVEALGVAGVRARGAPEPVTRDDRWHLGSCTKAMTATMLARLDEQDVLALDATLDELFPELADEMEDDWKHVTLLQLLQHRAGLEANPLGLWAQLSAHPDGPSAARAMLASEVLAAPPDHPPGQFLYSNEGYCLAGAAAERATGQTWEALVREHVFEPLHMTSAGFGPPGSNEAVDAPRGHREGKPVPPGPEADNPVWIGPAGTVHATLADWGRFAALHLAGARGEATPILTKASFERLHEPVFQSDTSYACGWLVEPRGWAGGDTLIHSGSNTLWRCVIFVAPKANLVLLATCNEADDAAAAACNEAVTMVLALWTARSLKPR